MLKAVNKILGVVIKNKKKTIFLQKYTQTYIDIYIHTVISTYLPGSLSNIVKIKIHGG